MRQLKQFMRNRKKQMLACDCWCYTLKCWRESTCVCNDDSLNSGNSTPSEPITSFIVEKVGDDDSTTYTSSKKVDWSIEESYVLTLNYNEEDELVSATITDWVTEKEVQNLENALWLASSAEEGLADNSKTEAAFDQFKDFYNSL